MQSNAKDLVQIPVVFSPLFHRYKHSNKANNTQIAKIVTKSLFLDFNGTGYRIKNNITSV